MQTLDNSIRFVPRRRLIGSGVRLQTQQDPERPNPTYIPVVVEFIERVAQKVNGIARGWFTEAVNVPVTAHILAGVVIGRTPQEGVIDGHHRVFGYENIMVCDGAAMPFNPGVNPSLAITALAERAMSTVPEHDDAGNAPGIGLEPRRLVRS
jgi:cholesterol oxidase